MPSEEVAHRRMYLFGLCSRRRHTSANRPNRLVRPHYRASGTRLNPGYSATYLAEDDLFNSASFALLQGLADADDWAQTGLQGTG